MTVPSTRLLRYNAPLPVALMATVVAALPPFLTGGVAVELQRDLGLSVRDLGAAFSIYFAAAAVSSTALGHLADRMGTQWSLRVGALTSTAALLGIAVWVHSLTGLLVCLALAGLAAALTHPSVNGWLAEGIGHGHLGLALGLKQSAIPVAALAAGVSVPAIALTLGWRAVFGAAAVLALLFVLSISRLATVLPPVAAPFKGRLGSRRLALLGGTAGLAAFAGTALATFLVSGAVDIGVSQGDAAVLLAIGSLASIAVRIWVGAWVDRRSVDALLIVVVLLVFGSIGFLGLTVGEPWLLVVSSLVAFGAGWGWQGGFLFAVISHNPSAARIATGVTQTGTYLGAALGPLLFGTIAAESYSLAWAIAAAAMLVAAALGIIARTTER